MNETQTTQAAMVNKDRKFKQVGRSQMLRSEERLTWYLAFGGCGAREGPGATNPRRGGFWGRAARRICRPDGTMPYNVEYCRLNNLSKAVTIIARSIYVFNNPLGRERGCVNRQRAVLGAKPAETS